jgi:hypothetical protein
MQLERSQIGPGTTFYIVSAGTPTDLLCPEHRQPTLLTTSTPSHALHMGSCGVEMQDRAGNKQIG